MSENKFIAMKSTEGGFINMKFRVSSPEQSAALQEKLFEMGYFWEHFNDGQVHFAHRSFIYTNTDGTLLWGDCDVKFSDDQSQEIDTQSFIDGTYEKEDVMQSTPKQEPSFREQLQQKVIEAWEKKISEAADNGEDHLSSPIYAPPFVVKHFKAVGLTWVEKNSGGGTLWWN